VAWSHELRTVHQRLRDALTVAREAVTQPDDGGPPGSPGTPLPPRTLARELVLYCRGFCVALQGHHEGEDRALFPAIEAEHAELADTLRMLERDHSMLGHLIGELQGALDRHDPPAALERHLDGIEAIMESHFRYEERQLLAVLETLALDAGPAEVLGPL
jgi:hemerythrin-like domain-containing protein